MRQLELGFYYNTTHLGGDELKMRRFKADAETRLILSYFQMRPGELKTPYDVYKDLGYEDPLKITNIRRSMTNLSQGDNPKLIKTDVLRPGERGAMNHCWKLA